MLPRRTLSLPLVLGLLSMAHLLWGCSAEAPTEDAVSLPGFVPEAHAEQDAAGLRTLLGKARPTGVKVLLVGLDGATFSAIDPLLEGGDLPVLGRMMATGVRGVLKSENPMKSPALWATIATGRSREVHGIEGFVRTSERNAAIPRSERPLISSNDRRVSALWNWMGPFGRTVGFQGWWATWPAEEVNGWMISDRVTRSRWTEWTQSGPRQHLTYPEALYEELRPLLVDPSKPPMDEINALAEFSKEERAEFLAAEKPIWSHGLSVFKFSYCVQRSLENIAFHMLAKGQPDLCGLFFIANDPVCHTFWHFYRPEEFEGVDKEQARRLGQLIPNLYRHNDRLMGRLLDAVDDNTVVLIVSDHGFQASGHVPQPASAEQYGELKETALKSGVVTVGQSGIHHEDGVLIAWGPAIRAGVQVQAGIYDVAPTVLALLGLPVPEDFGGHVLTEIIDEEFLAQYPVQRVASFDPFFGQRKVDVTTGLHQEEIMDRLKALGYVQ